MSLTKKQIDINKQIRYSNLITGCPFLEISKFCCTVEALTHHFLPLGRRMRIPPQERGGHDRGQVPREWKRKQKTSTRKDEEGRGRGHEV